MLQMVLYMKLKKIHSPAQWHEEARLNEAVQWLGYGYQPARRTWYDFRDRMEKYIDRLNDQLIRATIEEGLLNPEVGVQDGTSLAACAWRHRMVTS